MIKLKAKDLKTPGMIIGLLLAVANSVVLYLSFCHAYFINDFLFNNPINTFGEASIELVVFTVDIILVFIACVIILMNLHKKQGVFT